MEIRDYIGSEFENLSRITGRVLDGITHSESVWRPGPGCNSIALILFHMTKFEDMIIQTQINNAEMVWDTEKWYEKLKLPANDIGVYKTPEEIAAFSVPDFKNLRIYSDKVREKALAAANSITPAILDKVCHLPFGEFKGSALFVMTISHQTQHVGEMSYIRGLQRGLNK
jgi:hypothetical protein